MLRREDIGGAYIRRTFRMGEERVTARSAPLTREACLALPQANLNALIQNGFIDPYPLGAPARAAEAPEPVIIYEQAAPLDRMVYRLTKDGYDVVEGRKLNDHPLTKAEADALAAEGKGSGPN